MSEVTHYAYLCIRETSQRGNRSKLTQQHDQNIAQVVVLRVPAKIAEYEYGCSLYRGALLSQYSGQPPEDFRLLRCAEHLVEMFILSVIRRAHDASAVSDDMRLTHPASTRDFLSGSIIPSHTFSTIISISGRSKAVANRDILVCCMIRQRPVRSMGFVVVALTMVSQMSSIRSSRSSKSSEKGLR
jgi:hypothetical protein